MGMAQLIDSREPSWVKAHTALTRLARERAAADAEEGRWLLAAWRCRAHLHLGHGTFGEYIERLFGYRPRTTQDKLRAAEALESLPLTARALEQGALSWSAARELTRVAVPDTEHAWVEAALGKTIRQLEVMVASRAPGDTPESPERNLPRSQLLRFEVSPETFALFREAMLLIRRSTGGSVDDDGVLLMIARQVLGGPSDDGRASHQISLEVCPVCRSGAMVSGGERVAVGAEVVAMIECDAQNLGEVLQRPSNENGHTPGGEHPGAAAELPAHVQRASDSAADSAHVGAEPTARLPRAKQTIPPATHRAVLTRDRHCCRVPGCRNTLYVDVHHLELRSEGGRHDPDNLITLCSVHHRAIHRGDLRLDRAGGGHIRFCHADGTPYGQAVSADAVDAYRKVFSALRGLGFREREIREVLEAQRGAAPEAGSSALNVGELLRDALCRIRCSR